MQSKLLQSFQTKRFKDQRGWLVKPLTKKEDGENIIPGDFYLVMAERGTIRGNHYHLKATEWFSVIQGEAKLYLRDMVSGETTVEYLSMDNPKCIVVKPGIAHAFLNMESAKSQLIVCAYSDCVYDPNDTVIHKVI